MFIRDFIHVDQPFEVVGPRFVTDTSWLAPIAEEAAAVAGDVARALNHPTDLDPGPGVSTNGNGRAHNGQGAVAHERGAGRAVRCEVGPVRARAHSIVVPMWLIDVSGTAVLPDLSGDLEIAPVGSERCVIALGATYRRTSPERDELLRIERATEAGVRTFLSGIAAYLGRPVSAV